MTVWTDLGICLFGMGLGAIVTRMFFEDQIRELKDAISSLDQWDLEISRKSPD